MAARSNRWSVKTGDQAGEAEGFTGLVARTSVDLAGSAVCGAMAMKRGRAGVEYEDLRIGDGPAAGRGSKVEVRYDVFLNRGEQIQTDQHVSFRIGERHVIAGLEYGVEGMRAGGERRLRVGPHLAYREQAVTGVPPGALLEFHLTLLSVDARAESRKRAPT